MSKKKSSWTVTKPKDEKKEREIISNTAKAIFKTSLRDELKLNYPLDNKYLTIVPFTAHNNANDIVAYNIISKSNPGVEMYVDSEDIIFSLNGNVVVMDSDAITVAASNMVYFVKKYITGN